MSDNRFRRLWENEGLRPEGVLPAESDTAFAEHQGSVASQGAASCGDQSPSGKPAGEETPASGAVSQVAKAGEAEATAQGTEAASDDRTAQGVSVQDLTEELERVRAELAATRDQLLRAYAELDNFRKRVARQLEEERRYGELLLLRDLLPVLDDIYRAVEAAESTANASALKDGFRMVAEHLEQVLARHHCSRIEAEGQPFDPNYHEAVGQEPSDACPPNTVLRVLRTGYKLHDRVVRPAQVVVSLGKAPAPANN
ncbi:MAG: nucleotide exchange factor GrpE [Thermoguttaceae bacterium]|nr:nucleotide exchange factor GrpE [Thermoguttaceae bacterium]